MVCEHLHKLEQELLDQEIKVTARGQLWSKNCREWVYFDCVFADPEKTIDRLNLDRSKIEIHSHLGTHSGSELGLVCTCCNDAVMGIHPKDLKFMSRSVTEIQ